MLVKSGDAIDVKKGTLAKAVRGFAQSDFDSDEKGVTFAIRIIGKEDAIGDVVEYKTDDVSIKAVSDEKYSADPIERNEEEQSE